MTYTVTLVPGDGTGPELTEATRRVLEATGVSFAWDVQHAGVDVMGPRARRCRPETLESIRRNGVALKGPITTPIGTGFRSVNVALRHELGLYACVRPCKSYPGVRSRYEDVDLVVVRENTEDLYAGIEFESGTDDAHAVIEFLNARQPKQISLTSGISIKPHQPGRLGADHPLRLRVRARQRATPRLVHHQGEHHEAHGRALPRRVPRGGEGLPGHRGVGDARRRALHGARPAPRGVRRPRAAEPLRRHHQRPHRRPRRRARRRARREHRHRRPRSSRRRTARPRSTRGRTR